MRIVLTAAIRPQVTQSLTVVDASTRREQYAQALRWWARAGRRVGAEIIFVENSGEDLEAFLLDSLGTVPSHVRAIAAALPSPQVAARGKGAAEAEMIDAALATLSDAADSEMVYKCTGRLVVRNLGACVRDSSPSPTLVVEATKTPGMADSRFFGATLGLWGTLSDGFADALNDPAGVYFEHELHTRARALRASGAADVRRFAWKTWVDGQSGTSGQPYLPASSKLKRIAFGLPDRVVRLRKPGYPG